MRRRDVISVTGGAIMSWALPIEAQQAAHTRTARVGILNYAAAQDVLVDELLDALRSLGYVQGQNLDIEYRWADGRMDRLPARAAELAAHNVDVIVAIGPSVWAAIRATRTIPIVITFSGDPVGNGVVPNLARPGGNVTGFSYMSTDLAAKRLELLNGMSSINARIAVLYSPAEPATQLEMRETEAAARAIGVTLLPLAAAHSDELEGAFAAARHERAGGLIVFTHGFAALNRARIIEIAARHRVPAMYGWRDFVEQGGLMSYGPNIRVLIRKAARYVDRIIRGEKPGDLPVEQPDRLELVINLKTAKTLGIEIPPTFLARADEVIE